MSTFIRERLPDWSDYADQQGITINGRGKWRDALCVFHDDGCASMRINVESGGWVCMACGVKGGDVLAFHMQREGLSFLDAARALGAVQDDSADTIRPEKRRTLAARDALELLYQDSLVVFVAACNLSQGTALTDKDRADLGAAARRVLLVSREAT